MLALGRAVGGQLATLLAGGGALSGVGGLRAAAALSGTRLFSAQPSPADLDRAAVSRVLLQRSRGGSAAAHAALTPVPWGLHWSLAPLTHALLLRTCWHASVVLLEWAASAAQGLQCPGKHAAGTPVSSTPVPLPFRSLPTLLISIGCAGDVPRPRPGHGALHCAASTHQPGGAAGASAPGPTSGRRLSTMVVPPDGRPPAGAQAARGSIACLQFWSGLFRCPSGLFARGGKLAASLRSFRRVCFVLQHTSLAVLAPHVLRAPPHLPPLPHPWQDLKFGTVFTDHMFVAEHEAGRGWSAPAIKPLGMLQMHPAAQVRPSVKCLGCACSRLALSMLQLYPAPPARASLGLAVVPAAHQPRRWPAAAVCLHIWPQDQQAALRLKWPRIHAAWVGHMLAERAVPSALRPILQVLHYGMCCFEGMKAYHGADGRMRLFRPDQNMARLRRSARRLQLADFDPEVGAAVVLLPCA